LQCFRSTRRDHHFGITIDSESVEALLVHSDRMPQRGQAMGRRVLVPQTLLDAALCGVLHLLRSIGIREALTEVDRFGLDRKVRHFRENRRGVFDHPGNELIAHGATLVRGKSKRGARLEPQIPVKPCRRKPRTAN
jgi:hypothetical protein